MKFTDQLKQLAPGATLTTEKTKAVCYVTAKRCGLNIAVTDNGTTRTIQLAGSQVDDVADRVKALTAADRLKVFERFELCCGMNRGQCICEIETLQAPTIATPTDDKQTRLERARAALMSVETRVYEQVEETEPEWKFTKEPTWYDDTNTPYRRQWIQIGAKPTYRTVEVGEFDHNEFVRVK